MREDNRRRPATRRNPSRLLTIKDLARMLSVPEETIYRWRYLKTGPRGIKVGRHVRFRREDVEEWLDEHSS